jgi:hypothetical protein
MPILKRLAAAGVVITASLGLMTAPAGASDHLSHSFGEDNPGVAQRGFENPVATNPSGTSGAAAAPGSVPGEGDPNHGQDTGTPSVDLDQVCTRSGHGLC